MTMLNRLVLPLTALLLLGACAPDPQEQFARARDAFRAHDYAAARIDLNAALKQRPDDPAMLDLLARTQLRLEDGDGALASLRRLEALGKLSTDAPILYGDSAVLRGQFHEALNRVASVRSTEAARIRGLAYVALEDREAAAKAFAEGLDASGPRSALLAAYARFRLENGSIKEAGDLARQALAENAGEPIAWQIIGRIAAGEGRYADALAAYDKALKARPDDLPSLLGKIGALGDLGRIKDIPPLLDEAARIAPDNPRVTFFEAMLAFQKRDWAEVRKILQPKERELEDFPDLQLLYARALLEMGQVEQARAYLSPLLLQAPDNRQVRLLLGRAQVAGKDPDGALETLRPFAEDPQAGYEALALLAQVARSARDPREGVYAAMALTAKQSARATPMPPQ
jgi:predicted Zn-dependent protease